MATPVSSEDAPKNQDEPPPNITAADTIIEGSPQSDNSEVVIEQLENTQKDHVKCIDQKAVQMAPPETETDDKVQPPLLREKGENDDQNGMYATEIQDSMSDDTSVEDGGMPEFVEVVGKEQLEPPGFDGATSPPQVTPNDTLTELLPGEKLDNGVESTELQAEPVRVNELSPSAENAQLSIAASFVETTQAGIQSDAIPEADIVTTTTTLSEEKEPIEAVSLTGVGDATGKSGQIDSGTTLSMLAPTSQTDSTDVSARDNQASDKMTEMVDENLTPKMELSALAKSVGSLSDPHLMRAAGEPTSVVITEKWEGSSVLQDIYAPPAKAEKYKTTQLETKSSPPKDSRTQSPTSTGHESSQNRDVLMTELKSMKIASLQARNLALEEEIKRGREKLDEVTRELQYPAAETVKKHIKLLHDYNDIRDVGQGLVGMVADNRGVRIGELYEEFGVGLKD